MVRILHIIDKLSGAGPTRAIISLAKIQRELGLPYKHTAVTLNREAYPYARILAKQAGLEVILGPEEAAVWELAAAADIVQLHFWNTPQLYDLLRGPWPACRLLIWLHIDGEHAPQVVTQPLLDFADCLAATSPLTLASPQMDTIWQAGCTAVIEPPDDFERLVGFEARAHDSFNIGYIGTVNFGKLHPDFAALCAAVDVPGARFILCGGENDRLRQQVTELGIAERFEFKGFVENIRTELERFDVFGYPLRTDTYATAEKSLREAMFAGIPPVVFPHGGIKHLVIDGQTGFVVHSDAAYAAAITELYHNPAKRRMLGENAQAYAREHFTPQKPARQFDEQYQKMMKRPKRERRWSGVSREAPGAARFVEAMGDAAPQFAQSMRGPDSQAEAEIGDASPLLSGGEGGFIQYRNQYPNDPFLRFWAGLFLLYQGRREQAALELQAAVALGLDREQAAPYLRQAQEAASS